MNRTSLSFKYKISVSLELSASASVLSSPQPLLPKLIPRLKPIGGAQALVCLLIELASSMVLAALKCTSRSRRKTCPFWFRIVKSMTHANVLVVFVEAHKAMPGLVAVREAGIVRRSDRLHGGAR
jgi:hypothetical protein